VTVLAFLVQFGTNPHAGGLIGPIVLIAACAAAGGLMLPLLRVVVSRGRGAVRTRILRRRRVRAEAGAERRSRVMMSELCPHGWRAELTLYEGRTVTDLGESVRGAVALDWYELQAGGVEPAVMRRVWAPSVAEALEAMVADRRTDLALEQIELRASADGVSWPDA
jgi:hypothetical protein